MVGRMEPSFPYTGLPRKSPAGGLVTGYMWNEAMEAIDRELAASGGGIAPELRPFPPGTDVGELKIDAYSGIMFSWDGSGWVPESLSTVTDVTYYIDPAGDDDAIGDAGNPLATPQEAFDRMPGMILHTIVFDMAAGSYPSFSIKPMVTQLPGKIKVLGKDRLAQGLVGPNTGTATGGDEQSLDMAAAGWAVNELEGLFWKYVSGDHYTFEYRMTGVVVSNTANSFVQQGFGWDAPAINDVFEIRENTVTIDFTGSRSVLANNCGGEEIYFEAEDISDEDPGKLGIHFENVDFARAFSPVGRVGVSFSYCNIEGVSALSDRATGQLVFDNCMIGDALNRHLYLNGGMLATFNNSFSRITDLSETGFLDSYVSTLQAPAAYCLSMAGVSLAQLDNTVVSGAGVALGVILSFGWNGRFGASYSIIERSTGSGIGQQELSVTQSGGGSVYVQFCDIRQNARSGIFMQGGPVTVYASQSTVNNTRFGVEVRGGGILFDRGFNTLTGAIGDVSVDGAVAVAWAALPVAGLEANYAGGI